MKEDYWKNQMSIMSNLVGLEDKSQTMMTEQSISSVKKKPSQMGINTLSPRSGNKTGKNSNKNLKSH